MYLETVTGKTVDVVNPTPDQISLDDIAWGISRIPRFCGHTITAIPYNVAQHSIFVANEIKNICANIKLYPELCELEIIKDSKSPVWVLSTVLLGLLHDGSEVYTGDIPSPIKKIPELRPIIKRVEHNLMLAIYESLGIQPPTESQELVIKHADKIAQRIEAHAFMQSRGNHWEDMPEVSLERLQRFEPPMASLESYNAFMAFFKEHYDEYRRLTK